jgi:O-antigen/teichoic acid export membrane protein
LVLSYLKQGAYLPSYPAILILLVGYGIANTFFWNRPLLLAFGLSTYPLQVNALAGLVKTVLMFVLVPTYGFLAQAALLSAYLAVTVGTLVQRGLREMRTSESGPVVEGES